jgi:glutamate/tyrosine decarboxylase-like PLP-dependent enzyme
MTAAPDPFPVQGMPAPQVLAELDRLRAGDADLDRVTAYHFESHVEGLRDLVAQAARGAFGANGLNPLAFPSVARIENDLVAATAAWHGGGDDTVGTVTSGGTESCLLAVLGARERWRDRNRTAPAGDRPTVLLPVTAHPAFRKAAHLFDLDVVDLPVDPVGFDPDPDDVERLIDRRTALVVVSAPEYAYGTLDPVEPIAATAAEHDVPCHLDQCIGGFVLPFVREAEGLAPIGLNVPGVTSLSADLHKYGYAPKGVSVLLHASERLRRYHWYADAGWTGYPLVNPTLLSSRSAAPAAAAWAVLARLGRDGIRRLALASRRGALALADGVAAIPGLRVVVPPQATLVAFTDTGEPDGPDILTVVDELIARGWDVQSQPARHGGPSNAHITITAGLADQVEELLAALRDSADTAARRGRVGVDPALAAAAAGMDAAALDDASVAALLAMAGISGDGAGVLPDRMAPAYALLERLSAPVAERLLAAVLSGVYSPRGER